MPLLRGEIGLGRGRIKVIKRQEEGDVERILREVGPIFAPRLATLVRSNSQ